MLVDLGVKNECRFRVVRMGETGLSGGFLPKGRYLHSIPPLYVIDKMINQGLAEII